MIDTVVIAVKRFRTSSKRLLLKFYCFLKLADIIHCNFNDFISFYVVFFFFFVNKNHFENGLWKVSPNI